MLPRHLFVFIYINFDCSKEIVSNYFDCSFLKEGVKADITDLFFSPLKSH